MGSDPDGQGRKPRRRFDRRRLELPTQEELEVFASTTPSEFQRSGKAGRDRRRRHNGLSRNEGLENSISQRLTARGYQVRFRGDDLYVDGRAVGDGLRRTFADQRDWRRQVADETAFARFADRLMPELVKRQATTRARAFSRDLYARRASKGRQLEIVRAGQVVARVTAGTFTTATGEHRQGPFWAPGPHWDDAFVLLSPRAERDAVAASVALATRPRQTSSRSSRAGSPVSRRETPRRPEPEPEDLLNWPDDAPPELAAIATPASQALRERRIRSDDLASTTDCGDGIEITFDPLKRRRPSNRLDLPFAYRSSEGELRGLVHVKSRNTPLTITVQRHDENVDLLRAWTSVLELAAARYCGEPAEPGREYSGPVGFVADSATQRLLEQWVNPHRVRLPEGKSASVDALKAAAEVEIDLPDGHTWRRGHWRGRGSRPDGTVGLRYALRSPLRSLRGQSPSDGDSSE